MSRPGLARPGDGYVPRHMAAPAHRGGRRALRGALATLGALALGSTAAVLVSGGRAADLAPGAEPTVEAAAVPPGAGCAAAPVADRAGLVLVVGLPHVTEASDPLVDRLAAVGVGGVMLRDENLVDLEQAQALVDGLRARLGQELLVAVDEEGGRVTSLRGLGDRTPSARRLGAAGAEAAAEAAAELGALARSVDIDWLLAPVVDLDDGPYDGVIGDRSFGGDPERVAEVAGAFADELQDAGLFVTAKHFPGHGGEGDPHHGITTDHVDRATLAREDLPPFQALIDDGVEAVMVGHVAYPSIWGDTPASLEPRAYELLRDRGFDGIAITDALGMGAVHARWGFDVAPAMALAAGADVALVTQGDRIEELHHGLVAAVERGDLPEARLDEAVTRVLALRGQDPAGIVCPRG